MTEGGRLWDRQEAKLPLAQEWWALAGGRPGWRVAEVGCGAGRFALLYADLTGPTGHVHAVDIDPALLDHLRARLDPVHHAHVTLEAMDIESEPLPELGFDLVFLTDVAHHLPRLDDALANLRRSHARLLLADFDPDGPGDMGPPLDDRLSPDVIEDRLRAAGWSVAKRARQAMEHYAILARPV